MKPAYTYKMQPIHSKEQVIDGDSIKDVWIDLGFNVWHKTDIRLYGINAPEVRTLDLEEKARGIEATELLINAMDSDGAKIIKIYGSDKYGRWLGEIFIDGYSLNQHLLSFDHFEKYE